MYSYTTFVCRTGAARASFVTKYFSNSLALVSAIIVIVVDKAYIVHIQTCPTYFADELLHIGYAPVAVQCPLPAQQSQSFQLVVE